MKSTKIEIMYEVKEERERNNVKRDIMCEVKDIVQ
jgi:hypothetical protein